MPFLPQEVEPSVGEALCRLFPPDEHVDLARILRHRKNDKKRDSPRLENEQEFAIAFRGCGSIYMANVYDLSNNDRYTGCGSILHLDRCAESPDVRFCAQYLRSSAEFIHAGFVDLFRFYLIFVFYFRINRSLKIDCFNELTTLYTSYENCYRTKMVNPSFNPQDLSLSIQSLYRTLIFLVTHITGIAQRYELTRTGQYAGNR